MSRAVVARFRKRGDLQTDYWRRFSPRQFVLGTLVCVPARSSIVNFNAPDVMYHVVCIVFQSEEVFTSRWMLESLLCFSADTSACHGLESLPPSLSLDEAFMCCGTK